MPSPDKNTGALKAIVVPKELEPCGLNAKIPFPIVGDIVYHPEYDYWDVKTQSWLVIAETAANFDPPHAFTETLVYHFVLPPKNSPFEEGEYVRVLRDPPFDIVEFTKAMTEANGELLDAEIQAFIPSAHPSIRGLPDNTYSIQSRYDEMVMRGGRVRLKATNVREAYEEIVYSRAGVNAVELALMNDPLRVVEIAMDRVEGRPVQRVAVKNVGGGSLVLAPEVRVKLLGVMKGILLEGRAEVE